MCTNTVNTTWNDPSIKHPSNVNICIDTAFDRPQLVHIEPRGDSLSWSLWDCKACPKQKVAQAYLSQKDKGLINYALCS